MKAINLLFPHQLFVNHEIYENGYDIYLVEEHLFFREFNFHKTKIAFHRASMKRHQAYLETKGITIHYIETSDKTSDIRLLIAHFNQQGNKAIHFIDPIDNWLEKRIKVTSAKLNIQLIKYENPLFINTREELADFFKPDKKSFFQTTFYKQQRIKRNILIESEDQPLGGQWSFDGDNRKKYPKGQNPPPIQFPDRDSYWEEAVDYTEKHFSDNLGMLSPTPRYPTSHEGAAAWMQQFLEVRFHAFGDYEDAIVKEETYLHHSVLTPMMNVGLIAPMQIIEKAIRYAEANNVPINSLEGFVRQILGWREFIRGMYQCKGSYSRTQNFWGFERKIPATFYEGTTGIEPIDHTIKQVLKTGYCHHIERLMVLGNFMLLCEFHPDEVYRWFMELFIDAYDWVMVPNIYGMSQFADGGLFATKPYISGSNYLMKMSDYNKGEWQATWDGLFWRFMHVNREFFLSNPRLSMLVRSFDKMDEDKRKMHFDNAEVFLMRLDLP